MNAHITFSYIGAFAIAMAVVLSPMRSESNISQNKDLDSYSNPGAVTERLMTDKLLSDENTSGEYSDHFTSGYAMDTSEFLDLAENACVTECNVERTQQHADISNDSPQTEMNERDTSDLSKKDSIMLYP